jgi:metal-responsive CopG/Arc/MetJ family transcriptional regulator
MSQEEQERTRLDIRPPIELVNRLDAYIKRRPGNPSRAEVARSLIEEGLERDEKLATKRGTPKT